MSDRPAVFLDRDGIVNRLVHDPATGSPESPYEPGHVELEAGAIEGIERLADAGYALVVVSNQPAAAKGTASIDDLDAVHHRVVELLGSAASRIESWRYCRHHPEAGDIRLRECKCRKPAPGLLLDAATDLGLDLERSWMIGDAERDIEAGRGAGCRTVLVENPDSARRRPRKTVADARSATFGGAVDEILGADR